MKGTGGYYAKRNKSVRERQIPYDLTHMWNLRKKTDEHMGGGKGEREINHKRLLMIENKQGWWREVGGGWVLRRAHVMSTGYCM